MQITIENIWQVSTAREATTTATGQMAGEPVPSRATGMWDSLVSKQVRLDSTCLHQWQGNNGSITQNCALIPLMLSARTLSLFAAQIKLERMWLVNEL